jgi:hypothetical protein
MVNYTKPYKIKTNYLFHDETGKIVDLNTRFEVVGEVSPIIQIVKYDLNSQTVTAKIVNYDNTPGIKYYYCFYKDIIPLNPDYAICEIGDDCFDIYTDSDQHKIELNVNYKCAVFSEYTLNNVLISRSHLSTIVDYKVLLNKLVLESNIYYYDVEDTQITLSWKNVNSINKFKLYTNGTVVSIDDSLSYTFNKPTNSEICKYKIQNVGVDDNGITITMSDEITIYPKFKTSGTIVPRTSNNSRFQFLTSGSIICYDTNITATITVVGAGGSGSGGGGFSQRRTSGKPKSSSVYDQTSGGGGDCGDIVTKTDFQFASGTRYDIVVGQGLGGGNGNNYGQQGGYSKFDTYKAAGGLGGQSYWNESPVMPIDNVSFTENGGEIISGLKTGGELWSNNQATHYPPPEGKTMDNMHTGIKKETSMITIQGGGGGGNPKYGVCGNKSGTGGAYNEQTTASNATDYGCGGGGGKYTSGSSFGGKGANGTVIIDNIFK